MNEGKSKHFVGEVAQKAIVESRGKILVNKGKNDVIWEFPGGRLHDGETPEEGMRRELREEFGLDVFNLRPFKAVRSLHTKSGTYRVLIVYTANSAEPSATHNENELDDSKWITASELKPLPMYEDCEEVKRDYLKSK